MHVSGVLCLITVSDSVNKAFVLLVNSIISAKHKLKDGIDVKSFTCSSIGAPESSHFHDSVFISYMQGGHICYLDLSCDLPPANLFRKNLSGIPSVSNSFDRDQARHFIEPDLGPHHLQRLLKHSKLHYMILCLRLSM